MNSSFKNELNLQLFNLISLGFPWKNIDIERTTKTKPIHRTSFSNFNWRFSDLRSLFDCSRFCKELSSRSSCRRLVGPDRDGRTEVAFSGDKELSVSLSYSVDVGLSFAQNFLNKKISYIFKVPNTSMCRHD